ncbi:MAG: Rieske 2Fe-2S domain-containing protein [Microgenomates group bacterium]|jgi:Rieske Fe-S protein
MNDLKSNEGKVTSKDGQQIAVFKGETGKLHSVSAICTHMGCTVGWNNQDKTWDCPCHGSSFDKFGKVINGPAPTDLLAIELE